MAGVEIGLVRLGLVFRHPLLLDSGVERLDERKMPVRVLQNFLILNLVALALTGCQVATTRPELADEEKAEEPRVSDEYSLKADRAKFAELRKDIPVEKQNENDEQALTASLLGTGERPPSEIREKFDRLMRKKRENFRKDREKIRTTYSRDEKKRREAYLDQLKEQREEFRSSKHSADEGRKFYSEIEEKRRDFFYEEREKRSDFESDHREKQKDFEDYMREKQNEFQQELRAYTRRYDERQKALRLKEQNSGQ